MCDLPSLWVREDGVNAITAPGAESGPVSLRGQMVDIGSQMATSSENVANIVEDTDHLGFNLIMLASLLPSYYSEKLFNSTLL